MANCILQDSNVELIEHSPLREEDDVETTDMSVSGVGESQNETRKKMASSRKKKSKYEILEDKFNAKINELDAKLDRKLDDRFEMLLQAINKPVTKVPSPQRRDEDLSEKSNRQNDNNPNQSPHRREQETDSEDERMSITLAQRERQEMSDSDSAESDNESTHSEHEQLSEKTKKALFDIFGDDAITKKVEKTNGIALDDSQKEVLKGSWRAEKPGLVTCFAEETKTLFPMQEETETYLQVPSLDDLIGRCLVRKHGHKASFTKTGKYLFSQPSKLIENIAYRCQQAAALGITINMYIQQGLGDLIQTLSTKKVDVNAATKQVRDIFAMSTKSLDQIGRAGAFHHIIRRQVCMTDTSLYTFEDCKEISDLPLSGEGVFGDKLEPFLKTRKEKNKTLDDILPDFPKDKKRKNNDEKSGPNTKRHASSNSNGTKPNSSSNSRDDNVNHNFRIPKKSSGSTYRKDYNNNSQFRKSTDTYKKPETQKKWSFPAKGGRTKRA